MALGSRLKNMWNAFTSVPAQAPENDYALGTPTYSGVSPSRPRLRFQNERSIVGSIYTRIAIDVAEVTLRHCLTDELGRYKEDANSALNTCLMLEPNIDQGPRAFRQDIANTLFDKGVAAIVPVDTTTDPFGSEIFDIHTLRVGEICQWYPKHVKVSVYNEETGQRQEVTLEKRFVAIVENPLSGVMNEPNSTLQRLIRKLGMLDQVDEATSSGKLDMIIQLPYTIKTEARRQQAEQRRTDIEFQLKGSQYGIAYTDGTEKITQLNRPVENALLPQIEMLTKLLYSQLGITEEVMAGSASEDVMLNYFNRTVEPIVDAIKEAMQRSFLGRVGSKRGDRIMYFRDPFKLVPVAQLAEITDKFTRNEVLTSNEIRGFLGVRPAADPKADELVNSNMPQPADGAPAEPAGPQVDVDGLMKDMDAVMKETLDELEKQVADLTKQLDEQ